jgi:hypothetical protein
MPIRGAPLVHAELVVKEIVELPQGYFDHQLAGALVEVDARYQHNAVDRAGFEQ